MTCGFHERGLYMYILPPGSLVSLTYLTEYLTLRRAVSRYHKREWYQAESSYIEFTQQSAQLEASHQWWSTTTV